MSTLRFPRFFAAILIFLSLPSLADTLYSNSPADRLTWNAYYVGYSTDSFSIQMATPFSSPGQHTTATSIRVAVGIESGRNEFAVSLLSDKAGLPLIVLSETLVRDQMLAARSGYPADHWIDIQLSKGVDLMPNTSYWVSLRSFSNSNTGILWFQPSTNYLVENSYRNSTDLGGNWAPLNPYAPLSVEVLGSVTAVPEPASAILFLVAAFAFTVREYRKSKSRVYQRPNHSLNRTHCSVPSFGL